MTYKEEFIEFLIRAEALRFGEFTTKSGRLSPYFINAGMFRTGAHIERLGGFYADCVMNTVGNSFDILFGPAYKGIPLAVSASCALYRKYGVEKGYCFNRKEAKDHGEGGLFVGSTLSENDRLIIIEDVVTAGTAVREIMPLLESAKVTVSDMFIMVDRMETGKNGISARIEIKEEFGIEVHPIVTIKDILDYLYNREVDGKIYINDEIKQKIEDYIEKYREK